MSSLTNTLLGEFTFKKMIPIFSYPVLRSKEHILIKIRSSVSTLAASHDIQTLLIQKTQIK